MIDKRTAINIRETNNFICVPVIPFLNVSTLLIRLYFYLNDYFFLELQ